jgi:hypothetical protein
MFIVAVIPSSFQKTTLINPVPLSIPMTTNLVVTYADDSGTYADDGDRFTWKGLRKNIDHSEYIQR